jgi:hypothetical protein
MSNKVNDEINFICSEGKDDFTFYLKDNEAKAVKELFEQLTGEKTEGAEERLASSVENLTKVQALSVRAQSNNVQNVRLADTADKLAKKKEYSYPCRIKVLSPKDDDPKSTYPKFEDGDLKPKLSDCKDEDEKKIKTQQIKGKLIEICNELQITFRNSKNVQKELNIFAQSLNRRITSNSLNTKFKDNLLPNEREIIEKAFDDPRFISSKAKMPKLTKRIEIERYLTKKIGDIVEIKSIVKTGRALACFSNEGNFWSVTFRNQEQDEGYKPKARKPSILDLKNLNSIEEICEIIYKQVFTLPQKEASASEIHGLLVITGSTNSAKSLITRGLIYKHLKEQIKDEKRKRKPHLITYEDPIEQYYQKSDDDDNGKNPQVALQMKGQIDYTPRQKGKDAACLRDVLQDALRQTPSVLFVGETRDEKEWAELFRFAGTGHLVITTAHAGSLVEGMHNIFKALKVQTPAQRNEIASNLVGLIHLKREEIAGISILVPTLWRRTSVGLNALTSDGLASVLPHRPSVPSVKDNNKTPLLLSCLGRRWFIEQLLLSETNGKVKCDSHLKKIVTKSGFSDDGSDISDDFIKRLKNDANNAEKAKKNPILRLLGDDINQKLKVLTKEELAATFNEKIETDVNKSIKFLATEWDLRGE